MLHAVSEAWIAARTLTPPPHVRKDRVQQSGGQTDGGAVLGL